MNEKEQMDLNEQLTNAAQEGNIEQVRNLIKAGADVNGGDTPLHKAAKNGHIEVVKLLLDEGADINALGNNLNTPLHLAAEGNHIEVVRVLLDKGADVNPVNSNGRIPLHAAAENNDEDVAELLLEKGARIDEFDYDGKTSLRLATEKSNLDMVEFLYKNGADVEPDLLHLAVKVNNYHIVEYFLDKEVDINAKDDDGYTILHLAAKDGSYLDVKCLLDKGANVNAISNDRNTPLHAAAKNDDEGVAELLLEKGARIDAYDYGEKTPVDLAGENNNKDVMKLFLRNGENISTNTELLGTIIKYALLFNSEEVRPDYVVSNEELSNLWDYYQGEVEKMKGMMLGNTNISLYQFLQETDENQLAGYLSKENIGVREYFIKRQYTEDFPIYASIIVDQVSKARKQKELLDISKVVMSHSDDWQNLLPEMGSKIINYLENKDLGNVEALFVVPKQNLDNPSAEQMQASSLSKIRT